VSVPSEAVEWVCRSMRTTRTPGDDGTVGTFKDNRIFNALCHTHNS
jgi:hypothetical protein